MAVHVSEVGRGRERSVRVALLIGCLVAATLATPPVVRAQGYELEVVPILDVNGAVFGAEGWMLDEAWVGYLGLGYELPDPTDPQGGARAGVRGRMGLTIPVSPDGQVDMRVVHWPISWVPGWDGTTGLMVSWRQAAAGVWSWRLGAVVGNVWARRDGAAPVRAVVGRVDTAWDLAPELAVQPSLEVVVGSGEPGSQQARPLFGAVTGTLPFAAGDFRIEAKVGLAWPPQGVLVPGDEYPPADEAGRLGFRAGGWPAEFFVRGAAPAGGQTPGRAAIGLTVERRFALPELPDPLRWWPDATAHAALFADAAVAAPDPSFSHGAQTAAGAGVALGMASRAVGELQLFAAVSAGPTVRLGARLLPTP